MSLKRLPSSSTLGHDDSDKLSVALEGVMASQYGMDAVASSPAKPLATRLDDQSGAAQKDTVTARDGDVVLGVDAPWDDDLPINALSLNARFPKGPLFSSITRIRGTINEYTKKLGEHGWFNAFKPQTVQALARRLSFHEASVVGKFNIDVQIAYKQLLIRVNYLVHLHKNEVLVGVARQ